MKTRSIRVLMGAGLLASGCRREPAMPRTANLRLLQPRADTGLSLRVATLRDTILTSDHTPVEILYAVVNGPRPTLFDNNPERYQIRVMGPDGRPAESLGGAGPALGVAGDLKLKLPANGVLVQRQDLRCVNDAGYSAVPISSGKDNCLATYALTTPGSYRVTVEYFGPQRDTVTASGKVPRPAQDLHLSDTLTLVVTTK